MGVAGLVVGSLVLHKNDGEVVGFDGGSGAGIGKLALADDASDLLFVVKANLGLLLHLPLLHALNLELNFDADDDSFEDPVSGPCAFPLPAFNGAAHFFLVGC